MKNVRLLVVDESTQYGRNIEECAQMTYPGFHLEVKCTSNAEKTRELMKTWDPSVVIIDAYLPESNSFAMLEKFAGVAPVIMSSTSFSREIEISAKAKGAVGCIEKTDNLDELEGLLALLEHVSEDCEVRQ